MNDKLSKIFLCFLFVLLMAAGASAQGDASTANGRTPPKEELPKNIKESLEKQRIAQDKKDYDEMLKRGEEALQLSEELQNSFSQHQNLSAQDQKKLERLEKVLKKIRSELGGDGDDEPSNDEVEPSVIEEKPSTVVSALNKLQKTASNLVAELKKTSRFTVSVIAIQSSNALLKIVRFIRFTK